MKYIVCDDRGTEFWTTEFETAEEAITQADHDWDYLSEYDRKHCKAFYVLESVNSDEEAENHFDGNYIKVYK